MHAVLVTVDIEEGRAAEATQLLTGQVIPRVKDSDGFLHGTWARVEDDG